MRAGAAVDDKDFELLQARMADLTPAQFKALVQAYAQANSGDMRRAWDKSVYAVSEQHLADQSLLTRDYAYACPGIHVKTLFSMRLMLIFAMAVIPPPKLMGVIQIDETVFRESQKGSRELVSYLKGVEREPLYGYKPSKYGSRCISGRKLSHVEKNQLQHGHGGKCSINWVHF
ncbi:MAG: hypothetical protein MR033_06695 [Clostridiales bacterium]|nr:hypothetical protein [Clostridiales bacterium]